jgi:hypothetical protein
MKALFLLMSTAYALMCQIGTIRMAQPSIVCGMALSPIVVNCSDQVTQTWDSRLKLRVANANKNSLGVFE